MNNELRDPLEKVSNSLRRAVSVNKSRESDLRSKVNTIQRERRQSMNSWSLKQEKFLRAKLKMMPAIGLGNPSGRREREQTNTVKMRKITLTRGMMPITMEETETDDPKAPMSQKDLHSSSRNPLPPLIPPPAKTRTLSENRPYGFYLPHTRTIEEVSKTDQNFLNNLQKTRRVSEYKSPVHTYLYGNREEEQREAIRHKLSINEFHNAAHLARKVSCYGAPRNEPEKIMEDIAEEGEGAEKSVRHRTNNELASNPANPESKEHGKHSLPTISAVLPTENEQGNKKAIRQWRKIRESLSVIVGREKKKDLTKMSMLELTSLFEGIRDCRYLRVGAHTSYRGDSVDSKHCRCIACTVVDKTKLKNNLSAPK